MKKKKRSPKRDWSGMKLAIIALLVGFSMLILFFNPVPLFLDHSRWTRTIDGLSIATYSPDGQWIAAVGGGWRPKDKLYPEYTILDANSGDIIFESSSVSEARLGVVSHDGNYLMTLYHSMDLRVWNTQNWQLSEIDVDFVAGDMVAHPTENAIVLGTAGPSMQSIDIIDIPEGTIKETIDRFEYSDNTPVAISSTGDFIAYSRSQDDQSQISVVDMRSTEREKLTIPIPHMITDISWSPISNLLVFSTNDGQIFMWDIEAEDSAPEAILQQQGDIVSIGFSADGRYFAAGGEQPTTLYSTDDWSEILHYGFGHVRSIDFSPSEDTIAIVHENSPRAGSSLSVFELPEFR